MLRAASSLSSSSLSSSLSLLSSLLLLLLVLLLVLVLVLVRVVVAVVVVLVVVIVVVVVVFVVVGTIIVVSVVVAVVVIVVIELLLRGPVVVAVAIFVLGTFCKPPKIVKWTFFANPKKRQIGSVFAIFHLRGTKKHRKYQCFWLRTNAKPRYLRGFEPLRAKITVFTVFCGPSLAKTLLFTQFPACWQKLFLDAKGTKTL